MRNINNLTIQEARIGLKDKKFSVKDLVIACLDRIKKVDSQLNSFITVCENEILKQAEIAANEISNSPDLWEKKPLFGIPFALKDLYLTKGIRTTAASKLLNDYIPQYNATVVERLKNAGALIIGKTNCDAWAHGASGENSDFGSTHNPWDLNRTPGGSSSGSAVSVLADESLFAMGTDTGGSIRLPASFCNIVGLKPTYGRVSRFGIVAMASSLDAIGHFSKSVFDSALILETTAGYDDFDATTSRRPVEKYTQNIEKGIKGMKIGIPKEYYSEGLSSEIKKPVLKAIDLLKNLGAEIIEVSLPYTKYALAVYYIIQPSEVSSNLARYDGLRYGYSRDYFSDEAKRRIMLGTYTLSAGYYDAYYLKAMKVRTLIKQDFDKVFEKVDAVVTPVSPTLPFKLGEKTADPLQMYLADIYAITANLAGIPGLAIPVGFSNNLPVGMQILGPQFSEARLFKIGFAYEREIKWNLHIPKI